MKIDHRLTFVNQRTAVEFAVPIEVANLCTFTLFYSGWFSPRYAPVHCAHRPYLVHEHTIRRIELQLHRASQLRCSSTHPNIKIK